VGLCAAADVLVERGIRLRNFSPFDLRVLGEIQTICEELFPYQQAQVGKVMHAEDSLQDAPAELLCLLDLKGYSNSPAPVQ
jgi:hypothetical protein